MEFVYKINAIVVQKLVNKKTAEWNLYKVVKSYIMYVLHIVKESL